MGILSNKACPGCNGDALIVQGYRATGRAVVCGACWTMGPRVGKGKPVAKSITMAWEAWNNLPRHGDSAESARLTGILDDVRRVLKMELAALGDSILDQCPDLHPADVIEKYLVRGLVAISPAETLRESLLAHRLGAWASDLQAGKNAGALNWPIEALIRQVERLLNEPNPVLAELHDTIGEAFDAIKVQTQDEDGGPLDEPEYHVPNAKRAFDALSALADAVTRPKEKGPGDAARR